MYHQIQDLAREFKIIFISLTDEEVQEDHKKILEGLCDKLYIFKLNKFAIGLNIIKGLVKGWPVQVSYFFNRSIEKKISEIIEATKPDHIYVQLIRTTEYVKHLTLPKTLDYMDCFSTNSAKRAETSSGLIKLFWKWESEKVKEYEAKIFPFFDNHTIITKVDASQMPATCSPVTVIPNGIDTNFLNVSSSQERDIDLLFVGNLSYYSNVDAVHFIVKKIVPYLGKSLKIVIAGANPSPSLKLLVKENPPIELMPDVVDIKSIYKRSKVFIAPITKGTGMQNKILEAIASGCEVICSKEVSDGLGLKLNTVHIAHNAAAYISEIGNLLSHFSSHSAQRENSRNFLAKEFNWVDKNKLLIDIINKHKS